MNITLYVKAFPLMATHPCFYFFSKQLLLVFCGTIVLLLLHGMKVRPFSNSRQKTFVFICKFSLKSRQMSQNFMF